LYTTVLKFKYIQLFYGSTGNQAYKGMAEFVYYSAGKKKEPDGLYVNMLRP
jgi:hypothetical protein